MERKILANNQFAVIYDPNNAGQWGNHQPLTQKSINTSEMVNIKERPGSNKRQTPSKKHHTKSSSNICLF